MNLLMGINKYNNKSKKCQNKPLIMTTEAKAAP